MSFGAAAARRGRRPDGADPCPCGGAAFASCCGPILAGEPAPTPESLMRSRFTAFALGDIAHLEATWHPATRPDDVALDPAHGWEILQVIRADGGATDSRGLVEFRATWRDAASGERGTLHETSRFRRVGRRWMYLDDAVD